MSEADHRDLRQPNDEIPFVAVDADETPPWGDDLTCPRCGAQDLPLKEGVTIDKTKRDVPEIVLRYITHCGEAWLRGPIGR